MFGLGVGEIAIILFVALIFIGPKKLPELARGLGKGIREFQNAAKGLQDTIKNPTPTHTEFKSVATASTEEPDEKMTDNNIPKKSETETNS